MLGKPMSNSLLKISKYKPENSEQEYYYSTKAPLQLSFNRELNETDITHKPKTAQISDVKITRDYIGDPDVNFLNLNRIGKLETNKNYLSKDEFKFGTYTIGVTPEYVSYYDL